MFRKSFFIFFSFVLLWQIEIHANINRKHCDSEYDSCKKKPENLFNKKPCRTAREQCVASLVQSKKNQTKQKMLNGEPPKSAENSMKPWERSNEDGAAAARRRLKERAKASSMRESVKSN